MFYNGQNYFYKRNIQNDVTDLLDGNMNVVAHYTYDTWGRLVSVTGSNTTLGNLNPYRYRGYRYDTETGLYYLQSRYYDPEIGRFISADSIEDTGSQPWGKNRFAYCDNNPVMRSDPSGYIASIIISGIIGALINVVLDVITSGISYWARHNYSLRGFKYKFFSWNTVLVAASGFAAGLIISSKYSKWVCAIGGGIVNGFTYIINCIINKKRVSVSDLLFDVGFGLLWGYLGGNGVGKAYWQKNLFAKGGSFRYKGITYYSSRSLKLIRPVVKDFVGAFGKYIGTQFLDWLQKFARKKA